uniref:Uncharacterized protein n=1 Tax=Caenorhabditis japonica TaxID=281687 RepID=K7I2G5_CAEJA
MLAIPKTPVRARGLNKQPSGRFNATPLIRSEEQSSPIAFQILPFTTDVVVEKEASATNHSPDQPIETDATVIISDTDSEGIEICFTSPMPPQTPARPLATSTPRHQRQCPRPVKSIRPNTFAMTPRCARPTRAWIARTESKKEEPEETKRRERIRLSREERKEVWARLLAAKKCAEPTTKPL